MNCIFAKRLWKKCFCCLRPTRLPAAAVLGKLIRPLNLCPLPQAFENWTQQPGSTGFEKEDIQVLCQVFSVLGTTDLEGQISTLKLQQQALAQHLEQAQGAYQKYSKLYRTLGLMSGVCIAILLL